MRRDFSERGGASGGQGRLSLGSISVKIHYFPRQLGKFSSIWQSQLMTQFGQAADACPIAATPAEFKPAFRRS
jgi:hypothetical protein